MPGQEPDIDFCIFLAMKNFIKKATVLTFLVLGGFGFTSCLYEPEKFETVDSGASSEVSDIYKLNFANNKSQQICNPSVSQDTVNFPASMLWLNFTVLGVHSDDSGYTMKGVEQHDRLTVSDTSNKVLWFLMRDYESGECQYQDPEWSTHPNYITALRAFDEENPEDCNEMNFNYGMFAVRVSDKKKYWFYDRDVSLLATPHLWVDPTVNESESDSTLAGFFGTNNVRLVYVDKDNNILFVDFADTKSEADVKKSLSKPVKLKKPAGTGGWMMDSPMISPDGQFIVFNAFESTTDWKSYIQELRDGSEPVLLEPSKGSSNQPVQPRWFKYGERLFVLWAEFPSGESFVNTKDLTAASVQDGSAGRTFMREISLHVGAPADLAMEWMGEAREIAPIPMIGGRSPDGLFLATGTNDAYLLKLP